jgi:hypothetical protein
MTGKAYAKLIPDIAGEHRAAERTLLGGVSANLAHLRGRQPRGTAGTRPGEKAYFAQLSVSRNPIRNGSGGIPIPSTDLNGRFARKHAPHATEAVRHAPRPGSLPVRSGFLRISRLKYSQ